MVAPKSTTSAGYLAARRCASSGRERSMMLSGSLENSRATDRYGSTVRSPEETGLRAPRRAPPRPPRRRRWPRAVPGGARPRRRRSGESRLTGMALSLSRRIGSLDRSIRSGSPVGCGQHRQARRRSARTRRRERVAASPEPVASRNAAFHAAGRYAAGLSECAHGTCLAAAASLPGSIWAGGAA